jgi:hypothetical protein
MELLLRPDRSFVDPTLFASAAQQRQMGCGSSKSTETKSTASEVHAERVDTDHLNGSEPGHSEIAPVINRIHEMSLRWDRGDAAGVAGLFDEQSGNPPTIDYGGAVATGRAAIAALCRQEHAEFPGAMHMVSTICVKRLGRPGERGPVVSTAYFEAKAGGETVATGVFRDTFAYSYLERGPILASRAVEFTYSKRPRSNPSPQPM